MIHVTLGRRLVDGREWLYGYVLSEEGGDIVMRYWDEYLQQQDGVGFCERCGSADIYTHHWCGEDVITGYDCPQRVGWVQPHCPLIRVYQDKIQGIAVETGLAPDEVRRLARDVQTHPVRSRCLFSVGR